jgi:hypothetical protein
MECLMTCIDAIRPNKIYTIDILMHPRQDASFLENGVVDQI